MSSTHNIFISHIHEDDEYVSRLSDLLKKNGYDVRNGSIDSSKPNDARNPEYIKEKYLRPRINWAGTLVVLIGPGTHQSDWVNWEIEYAHRHGTPIVGIYQQGAKESDLPEAFERYGTALVGWNSDKLMGAVRGEHTDWCTPRDDGSFAPRQPAWQTPRVCQ